MRNPLSMMLAPILVRAGLAIWRADTDHRYGLASLHRRFHRNVAATRHVLRLGPEQGMENLLGGFHGKVTVSEPQSGQSLSEAARTTTGDGLAMIIALRCWRRGEAPLGQSPVLGMLHGDVADINSSPGDFFEALHWLHAAGLGQLHVLGGTHESLWHPALPYGHLVVVLTP